MPCFAAPVSPATTPSGSLGMLVGADGMHATSLLVVAPDLAAAVLDAALVVLSDPLLPQAASTTIDRAAAPMGRHLLQVRIVRSSSCLVTQYRVRRPVPRPRTLAGWADPGGAQPAWTKVSGRNLRVKYDRLTISGSPLQTVGEVRQPHYSSLQRQIHGRSLRIRPSGRPPRITVRGQTPRLIVCL